METTEENTNEWQLVVRLDAGAANVDGEKTVDLLDVHASVLGAADLRARTVAVATSLDEGVAARWAWLCGVAGRLVDLEIGGKRVAVDALAAAGRHADTERGADRVERHEVDASVIVSGADDSDVHLIQWSKRCVIDAGDADDVAVMSAAVWAAGLRDRRGEGGRLPQLHLGGVDVDLEGARLDGVAHRRTTNAAAHSARCEPVALTDRQRQLIAAADKPIGEVLEALGSGTDGELWNCPRPHRHTHGDAVPSAKVSGNAVRCFRCDTEWTDPLRLVMDVCNLGPDDAVAALSDPQRMLTGWRERIVAERARRSAVTV